jgi:DNA-binding LacI/PurR family transcriptional regulator
VINNGPRPTSPDVRERVTRAIHELDYHPNAAARGLRARRTNTIGFVVNDYYAMTVFMAWYTSAMLTGLLDYLKAEGYYILVYPMPIGEDFRALETLLRSGRLDGVVLRLVQEPPATDGLLELIAGTHVPCVCVEQPASERFGFGGVSHANYQGALEATNYLIAQGHQRIAHVHGDLRFGSAQARLAGYRAALSAAGLPIEERFIAGADWNHQTVAASLAPMLGLRKGPSAIFAASDALAIGASGTLQARGRRVPEDVAVMGFDDSEMASFITPALTTVRIPLQQIGRRAGEMLLELVRDANADTPAFEMLPVEIVRRASA